jgi:LacI family transcriptional regulator
VDPATQQQVREVIERLGYRRNVVARALATARTMNIGVCVPVTANPTFVELVDVIESRLTSAGYSLMLHDTRDDRGVQARLVRQLLDLRADGIILAPAPDPSLAAGSDSGGVAMAIAARTPLVLIDRFVEADCDQVGSDGVEPMRMLTEHLAANGHRRIAIVAGLSGIGTTVERLQGYRAAVTAMGLDADPALVVPGESDREATRAGLRALFARPDRPTAVVTTNNVMTLGAMRAFADLGLRVPDDVALVCFDDFDWADLFSPRLTAVGQDLAAMADKAVELLLRRIADPAADLRRIRVKPMFQHRDSCGCRSGHRS